ncbi:hypothetical protein [Amycolatopsis benzoatilytica]|uniref:hypothetical protein n=1 Tax=Amycolatopsis benzoatilytica TaxID=346045 RepID=UPI0003609D16|nr:hypothetical protein [Amycolatopsis benzoatilytica]
MTDQHRAQHVESAGDYYARTYQENLAFMAGVSKWAQQSTQDEASTYSVQQGQQLLQGQQTRSDAPAPDANYASFSHEDLHKMVNHGLDFDGINERSRVTNTYGNWLADASNQFRDAATTAGAEWQGAAAEQAHSFFQSTAEHTEQTGNAMQLVSNRYSQQSAAADYAHRNMPEPTGFNQQAEIDKATQAYQDGNPIQGATAMANVAVKQQAADAAHQQAVQVMHNLDQTYHETSTTQPVYAPPPQMNSDSTTASSAAPVTTSGGMSSGPYTGPGGHAFSGSGSSVPNGPGGSSGFVPPAGGSGGTPYNPAPGVSTGTGPLGNPGLTGGTGGLRPTPGIGGRLSPEGMTFGGNVGTPGSSSESTSTRGRAGTGAGGTRGGGAGGRVTGAGESEGKPGEGKGSGKGAAERLERGATAAANAGGKGGKAGAAGAGAAGGGKKKEDDKEHKNKIPTQVDPDEVFEVRPERGPNGEKITPPVLGG